MIVDSYATSLTDELLLGIFQYLKPKQLSIAGRVCRKWYVVTNDYTLWKPYAEINKEFFAKKFQANQFVGVFPINNKLYLANSYRFKVLYQKQPMLPVGIDLPRHEVRNVVSFCPFTHCTKEEIPIREIKILTGCSDTLCRLWTIVEGENHHFRLECMATMAGHVKPVVQIKTRNDHIFTASEDQSVKIWRVMRNSNLRIIDIKCLSTIRMTSGKIIGLIPLTTDFQNFSFLAAFENRIERYQLDSKEQASRDVITNFSDHRITAICQLILKQNIFINSYSSGELAFWQMNLHGKIECIQKLKAHERSVTALVCHSFKQQVISGSWDGELCIWEKKKTNEPWELRARFSEHDYPITAIKFGPHLGVNMPQIFFSLHQDNTIVGYEFSVEKNEYVVMLKLKGLTN